MAQNLSQLVTDALDAAKQLARYPQPESDWQRTQHAELKTRQETTEQALREALPQNMVPVPETVVFLARESGKIIMNPEEREKINLWIASLSQERNSDR